MEQDLITCALADPELADLLIVEPKLQAVEMKSDKEAAVEMNFIREKEGIRSKEAAVVEELAPLDFVF